MRHKKESLAGLFEKIFQRKATATEKEQADRWFNQLDLHKEPFFNNREEEDELRMQMQLNLKSHIFPPEKKVLIFNLPVLTRIAAAALIFITLFIGFYSYQQLRNKAETFTAAADAQHIRQVILPDGTQVTLNYFSRISWTSDYNSHERRVSLLGEGFFDVKKDLKHPFIVTANNIETIVHGTAFNVESYINERQIKVSLVRGHVSIRDNQNSNNGTELLPGQMMAYNRDAQKIEVKPTAVADPAAWMKGGLVFNDIPLATALNRLQTRYGLTLKYNPQIIQGKTVTASFTNASWQEALHGILFMHDLDFKQSNHIIYIR